MEAIDKECNNCKWFVDCDRPDNLAVCPDWEEEEQ